MASLVPLGPVTDLEVCPSALAHSEAAAWVQSKSSARRARRFRVAFLSGVQCYQHGAPGLSLTSDEAGEMVASLARHEIMLVADGHSPSIACSPVERPTASCGFGLPPVEGYSRVGIGIVGSGPNVSEASTQGQSTSIAPRVFPGVSGFGISDKGRLAPLPLE